MTDALAVLAASWGVLMALSPTLQVRRMLARRSSADVSLAYLAVLQVGFGLWVGYGLSIGNWALVVPNATVESALSVVVPSTASVPCAAIVLPELTCNVPLVVLPPTSMLVPLPSVTALPSICTLPPAPSSAETSSVLVFATAPPARVPRRSRLPGPPRPARARQTSGTDPAPQTPGSKGSRESLPGRPPPRSVLTG